MWFRSLLIALCAALALAACQTPGASLPALPAETASPYELGPGDVLQVRVFEQPELSGQYTVGDGNALSMPLIGSIPAGGKTLADLEQAITAALQKRQYANPRVSVQIERHRPVFVLGEVSRPGQYPWEPGLVVASSVALAGGYTPRAFKEHASVTRRTEDGRREMKGRPLDPVKPGDIITIFERTY